MNELTDGNLHAEVAHANAGVTKKKKRKKNILECCPLQFGILQGFIISLYVFQL